MDNNIVVVLLFILYPPQIFDCLSRKVYWLQGPNFPDYKYGISHYILFTKSGIIVRAKDDEYSTKNDPPSGCFRWTVESQIGDVKELPTNRSKATGPSILSLASPCNEFSLWHIHIMTRWVTSVDELPAVV